MPPPQCPAHAAAARNGTLVNLFSDDAVADPGGTQERLRAEHGAVAPVVLADNLPAWLVLGYRENLEVARTPARFTRDSRVWNLEREGKVPAHSPLRPMTTWKPVIRFAEGAEHGRLRAAVNDSLAAFNRRGIRRYITRYANQLIDEFCVAGRADLVAQFVQHLPMLVLARLFGLSEEAGVSLVKAIEDITAGAATAVAADELISTELRELVTSRRAAQESDLASWLIGHPAALNDQEVMQNLRITLVIANDTTSSLMGSTLRLLLTDLRFRASLAGGHMTLPDAVEQVLWDEPPFRTLVGRWSTADTEVGGQKIRAGDLMLMGLAAGNADPAIRPDLDAPLFGNRSHLAFGGGPHECPGQDISRAICETGIDTLLTRLPDLALGVAENELTWKSAWVTRHLATLPVTFTRRRQQGDAAVAAASASVPGPAPQAYHVHTPTPAAPPAAREPVASVPGQQDGAAREPAARVPAEPAAAAAESVPAERTQQVPGQLIAAQQPQAAVPAAPPAPQAPVQPAPAQPGMPQPGMPQPGTVQHALAQYAQQTPAHVASTPSTAVTQTVVPQAGAPQAGALQAHAPQAVAPHAQQPSAYYPQDAWPASPYQHPGFQQQPPAGWDPETMPLPNRKQGASSRWRRALRRSVGKG